jgi:hypothetical protein
MRCLCERSIRLRPGAVDDGSGTGRGTEARVVGTGRRVPVVSFRGVRVRSWARRSRRRLCWRRRSVSSGAQMGVRARTPMRRRSSLRSMPWREVTWRARTRRFVRPHQGQVPSRINLRISRLSASSSTALRPSAKRATLASLTASQTSTRRASRRPR